MRLTPLEIRGQSFFWGRRTYVMGVLNVTPDSFSDGGEFNSPQGALSRARAMVAAGVDLIDVGGQSTRPGAEEVSVAEECARVIPVLELLRRSGVKVPISIDTTRAVVARSAVAVGADMVNDISGAQFDPEMLGVVAELRVPLVLMHLRGTPATMQSLTDYQDLIGEIYRFFEQRIERAVRAGIKRHKIIVDPGLGFAKTYPQNMEIIQNLGRFRALNCPLLLGPSRKSFLGHILGKNNPKDRVWGTGAVCCGAIAQGVDLLRVHDVPEMVDVCRVADAIWRG